ncbi:MAG: Ig-like domain-containing protein, partial [bacterium]
MALNKPATQYSTNTTYVAGNAVDGNAATYQLTNTDVQAYWQVDLQSSVMIDNITILPRTGYESSAGSSYVFVSDNAFGASDLNTLYNDVNVWKYLITDAPGTNIRVNIGRTGRYVRVQRNITDYLNFSECQIYTAIQPTAGNGAKGGFKNSTINFSQADFVSNFTDSVYGYPLTKIKVTALPANGTLKLNNVDITQNQEIVLADLGGITFIPTADWTGTTTFTWLGTLSNTLYSSNTSSSSNTATVTITVNPTNITPTAADNAVTVAEDTNHLFVATEFNFSDANPGDIMTNVKVVTAPTKGTLYNDINSNGIPDNGEEYSADGIIRRADIEGAKIKYKPSLNENGIPCDTFAFAVSDGYAWSTLSYVMTVNVTPVNDAPVANVDTVIATEDLSIDIDVLSNDTDVEADILSITAAGAASHGTTSIVAGKIRYAPVVYYHGTDSFTYSISDGNAGTATGTVNVSITHVNHNPIAVNDNAVCSEDGNVSINVLSNDTDVDVDTLSVSAVTQPSHGYTSINGLQVQYTPNLYYYGLDSFTYTTSDGQGGTSIATVNVTINHVNHNPSSVGDLAITSESVTVDVSVLSNDSDIDSGDTLSISAVGAASNGTTSINGTKARYTPNLGFTGSDSFTYTVSDGNGGTSSSTVNVTINLSATHLTCVNDSALVQEDSNVNISVLANDSDVAAHVISITGVSTPTNGTAQIVGTQIKYTPNLYYHGNDSFTYNVSDGQGNSSSATVNVTINHVNHAPVGVADTASTPEDTQIDINVVANDTDADSDSLTVSAVGTPAHGTASIVLNKVRYTPTQYYNGADSLTYTLSDGNGGTSSATVSMTVTAVENAPTAASNARTVNEDATLAFTAGNFGFSDVDTGDVLTDVKITSIPGTGTLYVDTDLDGIVDAGEALSNNNTVSKANIDAGRLKFKPVQYTYGTPYTTFAFKVSDGIMYSTSAYTMTINITHVNHNPVAIADSISTLRSTLVDISVLGNDTDVDSGDILSLVGVTSADHGSVAINGSQVRYTPTAMYTGQDSFMYSISDGNGGSSAAVVNVTVVRPSNASPVAVNDSATTTDTALVNISVLSNDTDADLDALSISAVSTPANGTAQIVNSSTQIRYTPNLYFNGTETITYTVIDGVGGSATGTVTVTVGYSDTSAVVIDKAALVAASILNGNSALNNIMTNLTVPAAGANGTTITWSSGDVAVVANDGTVTRPAGGDSAVNLTATITKNAASDTKAFALT